MTDIHKPITKFAPSWLPIQNITGTNIINESFTLDIQYDAVKDQQQHNSKIYVMYFSFIMNGKYTLTVQRRTKDFSKSAFQIVISSTDKIQNEINKMKGSKNEFTVSLEKYERISELNFSEIYEVEVTQPNKLTIVGMKHDQNYVIRQYRLLDSTKREEVLLKHEFTLSLSMRSLVIKEKRACRVFKTLQMPKVSQFLVTSFYSEGNVSCFICSINTFNCPDRWVICVYNGNATRTDEKFKSIEIRSNIIRGKITGICLLKQQSKVVVVTNTFQLLIYDIHKKKEITLKYIRLLKNEPFLFESDQEFIYTRKVIYKCHRTGNPQEVVLACSKSGKLYSIPETYNPVDSTIHSVDIASCFEQDTKLNVERFTVCNFTKQCFLQCTNGTMFGYDINTHKISHTFHVNTNELDYTDVFEFPSNQIDINWYGDELYYCKDNLVNVYTMNLPSCSISLEDLCKRTLLENFSVSCLKIFKIKTLQTL